MDTLLNRYRNITVLLLVIFAQLVLLAYQVKNDRDVRLIRMWAVISVTPVARAIEFVRDGVTHFTGNYVFLKDAQAENRRMQKQLGELKLENQYLKNELSTADRAQALAALQAHSPSRMVAARVVGAATGGTSKAVFVDRGTVNGVEKGMAVVTPDGIVGKVLAVYPNASLVLLVTDSVFAAGVVSQKNHVRGVLKGSGFGNCRVDYVQPEDKVEVGEWFYTSGDDRIFPKGMPAGKVTAVRPGSPFQEVLVDPSGNEKGLEEVLIVLQAVHQEIPDGKSTGADAPVYLAPPPPAAPDTENPSAASPTAAPAGAAPVIGTDADRLRERYKEIGEAQKHKFGEGAPGTKPPDFNLKIERPAPASAPNAAPPSANSAAPAAAGSGSTTPAGTSSAPAPRTATPPASTQPAPAPRQ
ncbi:MAG: rod shape-determining protein MreC [Candidatus Solibacter usitatus]|nr:rod shape-determining protein MreC [Candidatus Solibacter usitatus]